MNFIVNGMVKSNLSKTELIKKTKYRLGVRNGTKNIYETAID